MTAAIIAEALAHAERSTDDIRYDRGSALVRFVEIEGRRVVDGQDEHHTDCNYVRRDVVDAVGHYLAKMVLAERERAERAEARVHDFVTTILDAGYSGQDSLGLTLVGEGSDKDSDDLLSLVEYAQAIRKEDAAREGGR